MQHLTSGAMRTFGQASAIKTVWIGIMQNISGIGCWFSILSQNVPDLISQQACVKLAFTKRTCNSFSCLGKWNKFLPFASSVAPDKRCAVKKENRKKVKHVHQFQYWLPNDTKVLGHRRMTPTVWGFRHMTPIVWDTDKWHQQFGDIDKWHQQFGTQLQMTPTAWDTHKWHQQFCDSDTLDRLFGDTDKWLQQFGAQARWCQQFGTQTSKVCCIARWNPPPPPPFCVE